MGTLFKLSPEESELPPDKSKMPFELLSRELQVIQHSPETTKFIALTMTMTIQGFFY